MKRSLLASIFFVFCFANTKANDTLTRRQIYNFNVGDTFDYKTVYDYAYYGIYSIGYHREIVTDKYVSPNADTIIYVMYGNNLLLTQLDSFELSLQCRLDTMVPCNYIFDSLSGTNIPINSINIYPSFHSYAKGLGESYRGTGTYDMGNHFESKELIYFSKDTTKWGTPYTQFTGFSSIRNPHSAIRILPNPATSSLIIQSENIFPPQTTFQLFELSGRMVLQQELSAKATRVELVDVSSGMYLYNVVEGKEKVNSGKLIIE
jgi:hypothetical protein